MEIILQTPALAIIVRLLIWLSLTIFLLFLILLGLNNRRRYAIFNIENDRISCDIPKNEFGLLRFEKRDIFFVRRNIWGSAKIRLAPKIKRTDNGPMEFKIRPAEIVELWDGAKGLKVHFIEFVMKIKKGE